MRTLDLTLFGVRTFIQVGKDERAEREAEHRATNNYFEGDYENWQSALADARGYDQPTILQKAVIATRTVQHGEAAYERDTVVYKTPAYSHPQLTWLLYAASRSHGKLHVLDFGGALGSTYHQHHHALNHLPDLLWGVVEQAHYVEAGRSEFSDQHLSFHFSLKECSAAVTPNFGLLSATLQYLEKPYQQLEEMLSLGLPYLLLDKTLAHRLGRDRLVVQHVPSWIYDASYPVWLLDADRLEKLFSQYDYKIGDTFDPYPGSTVQVDDFCSAYSSWFLEKRF
ncbi:MULTISPECIES: methyltransferase, TIGR04325 family [unclassified Herbaspirillum]|uniref:methyltransferase, TIGR04325 family n=1 Tax=unclassified Herbaspirillum TaxID=2624150 RepID=UPI001314D270|nr:MULTISPECIES: methyltransferase, TIGR04325 family [unclassified Herbaspirillum]